MRFGQYQYQHRFFREPAQAKNLISRVLLAGQKEKLRGIEKDILNITVHRQALPLINGLQENTMDKSISKQQLITEHNLMKQPNSNPTKMTVSAILPNHRKIQLENYHLKPTSRILHRSYDTMSYGNISSQDHQIMLHKKNSKEKQQYLERNFWTMNPEYLASQLYETRQQMIKDRQRIQYLIDKEKDRIDHKRIRRKSDIQLKRIKNRRIVEIDCERLKQSRKMHELGDILKDMSVKLARNTKLLVEAIDQSKLTNCTVDEFNRVTRSNKKSVVSRIVERKKEWDGQLVNGQMDMSQQEFQMQLGISNLDLK